MAGVGLIKVAVKQDDGTSNVILEGIERVKLLEKIEGVSYPCYRIKKVEAVINDEMGFKESMCHLYGLMDRFLSEDVLSCASGALGKSLQKEPGLADVVVKSLETLKQKMVDEEDPERVIDLIACTFLQHPAERQIILGAETLDMRIFHIIDWMEDQIEGSGES